MYKLIIVDDEMLVQIGIKSMLNWEREDIEIAGIASNGEQAYELIKSEQADIVITDIKMPVLGGMELIQLCNETLENIPQFILLTSHEEFSLAKEAVKLNVVDYLVKLDLSVEAILSAVNLAKERVEQKKGIIKNSSITDVKAKIEKLFKGYINGILDNKTIKAEMALLDADMLNNLCLMYVDINIKNSINLIRSEEERIYECVESAAHEIISKEHKCYIIPYRVNRFFILISIKKIISNEVIKLNIKKMTDRAIKVNSEYFNVGLKIGISSFDNFISGLNVMYNEARYALRYVKSDGEILFYEDIEICEENKKFDITILSKEIMKAWESVDSILIQEKFNYVVELFMNKSANINQVKDCCHRLMYFVITSLSNGDSIINSTIKNGEEAFNYINNLNDKEDIKNWILDLSKGIIEEMTKDENDYSNRIVQKARKYILENKGDKLSLLEVANILEVNSSYLSMIFKKCSKIGFSDYVTKIKIEYSKELLLEDKYKIYEVAQMVGYDNAYYFSKVFKKYTGVTPKEFVLKKII